MKKSILSLYVLLSLGIASCGESTRELEAKTLELELKKREEQNLAEEDKLKAIEESELLIEEPDEILEDNAPTQEKSSNWTESDKRSFKADCQRGLEDSNSSLTYSQRSEYCDCIFNKIESAYPDKYSQQDIEWMKRKAKECLGL